MGFQIDVEGEELRATYSPERKRTRKSSPDEYQCENRRVQCYIRWKTVQCASYTKLQVEMEVNSEPGGSTGACVEDSHGCYY